MEIKKKRMSLVFIFPFILLFFLINILPIRPVITMKNGTDNDVYIYSSESLHGVEPGLDDVEKIKRKSSVVIKPGKVLKIKASFSSLIINGSEIDISWRIGGGYEYNSIGGGWRNFLLSSTDGVCSVVVVILEGYNKDSLKYDSNEYCLKKISPFRYKY